MNRLFSISSISEKDLIFKGLNQVGRLSDFQKKVYREVLSIPLGQVRTYEWVAKRIKNPKAVRAVANALKNNPFPVVIPCHRVVRKDGTPGGYNWGGVKKKKSLIDIEKKVKGMIQ